MLNVAVKIVRFIIALIFITTAILKLVDISSFIEALITLGNIVGLSFPSIVFNMMSVVLLLAELMLGISLLFNYKFTLTSISLFILTLSFIFTNLVLIIDGNITECFCFGDIIKSSPQTSLLIDFAILIFLIVLVKLNSLINKEVNNETKN